MIKQIKSILLSYYLNLRLKYFKSDEDICNYQARIDAINKILLILPIDCLDKTEYNEFIVGLNKIFSKAKVSTFHIKNIRLHEQNWLGAPNEQFLGNLRSQAFGLIIDLNMNPDKICAYICALSKIPIRINLKSGKYDHIYNLYFRSEQAKTMEDRYNLILDNLKKIKMS